MTNDEVMNLSGDNNPVLCADGKLGMLLIYPRNDGLCGIQVHGEEHLRHIDATDLSATEGGALRQIGAPVIPPKPTDMVQMMLAVDWVDRGGIAL